MSERKDAAILKHVYALHHIFPASTKYGSPIALYKRLHRLEAEAHRLAERECNEQLPDGYSERKQASILKRLDTILGYKDAGVHVFLNGDPRGYALKIMDTAAKDLDINKDWGGYGIICPEF